MHGSFRSSTSRSFKRQVSTEMSPPVENKSVQQLMDTNALVDIVNSDRSSASTLPVAVDLVVDSSSARTLLPDTKTFLIDSRTLLLDTKTTSDSNRDSY